MARFEIIPVPKPRMTQSDKWGEPRPPVARYWAFKDELQRQAGQQDFELSGAFVVVFYLPMPKSWSKRKRAEMMGLPHEATPDKDNLMKALSDSLLPSGDAVIWFDISAKVWAVEGAIVIKNLDYPMTEFTKIKRELLSNEKHIL